MSKFILIQTAIGDYRQKVLELVCSSLGKDFHVYSGREYFEASTKTRVNVGSSLTYIKNYFFFGRSFLFQVGAFWKSILTESVILEMNPRIASVWIVILIRRLLGKKTVLWGHAWPREGKESKTDKVRNILRSTGSHILVYTETQKIELQQRMPNKSISAAPNALYERNDMWVHNLERDSYLYVGRLVDAKKPRLMIEAYAKALSTQELGPLLIVGDGPERKFCEKMVKDIGLSGKVVFKGHVADLEVLRRYYSSAVASVSPGYVGLSITQSFSFGTPMLIADKEPHAPEIEAAVDGVNSLFFRANDADDLADKFVEFWNSRKKWRSRELAIIDDCKERYSAELMASRIVEAFKLCER